MSFLTAQTSQPPASTLPPPPNALTEWGILAAAGVWLIKQGWTLFADKEKHESELTSSLIDDLRKDRSELLVSNRQGFADIVKSIGTLQETLRAGQSEIDSDFQTLKRDQAGVYANLNQTLGQIKQSLEALHQRLDELTDQRKGREQRSEMANLQ